MTFWNLLISALRHQIIVIARQIAVSDLHQQQPYDVDPADIVPVIAVGNQVGIGLIMPFKVRLDRRDLRIDFSELGLALLFQFLDLSRAFLEIGNVDLEERAASIS